MCIHKSILLNNNKSTKYIKLIKLLRYKNVNIETSIKLNDFKKVKGLVIYINYKIILMIN